MTHGGPVDATPLAEVGAPHQDIGDANGVGARRHIGPHVGPSAFASELPDRSDDVTSGVIDSVAHGGCGALRARRRK